MDALMSNFAGHFEHQVAAADESPAASSSDDDGGGGDDAAQLSEGEAASQELIRRMMQDEATAAVTTSRPRRERKQVQSYTDTDALEPTAPRPREAARKRRGGESQARLGSFVNTLTRVLTHLRRRRAGGSGGRPQAALL
jgi:hypothetical protein